VTSLALERREKFGIGKVLGNSIAVIRRNLGLLVARCSCHAPIARCSSRISGRKLTINPLSTDRRVAVRPLGQQGGHQYGSRLVFGILDVVRARFPGRRRLNASSMRMSFLRANAMKMPRAVSGSTSPINAALQARMAAFCSGLLPHHSAAN